MVVKLRKPRLMETFGNVLWVLVYLAEQARGSYEHVALFCAPQILGMLSALNISCGLLWAFLTLFSKCCHELVTKIHQRACYY